MSDTRKVVLPSGEEVEINACLTAEEVRETLSALGAHVSDSPMTVEGDGTIRFSRPAGTTKGVAYP